MGTPSLKKVVVVGLATAVSDETLNSNNLVLITASGTIIGKPVPDSEVEELKKNFSTLSHAESGLVTVQTLVKSVVKAYKEDFLVQPPFDGNDGYILLKDVTIQNSGINTTLPVMAVFFDQIIGASIGKA